MRTPFREHRRGRLAWLSIDLLESRGVTHGFTLRYGGVSRGGFASLNFTTRQGDRAERVRENWRRFEAAAGLRRGGWALVSQVHGAEVVAVGEGREACHHRRDCPEADAVVAGVPGVALGVLTADCLPVLLAGPAGRAVAVAHAGWRGTLLGVAPRALEKLPVEGRKGFGEITAGLGPAVGRCCCQVGDEVYEAFRETWGRSFARQIFTRADPWRLDLQHANRIQLLEAGLRDENIASLPFCTVCRPDLFFSHRRDGERTGRMLSFASVSPGREPAPAG